VIVTVAVVPESVMERVGVMLICCPDFFLTGPPRFATTRNTGGDTMSFERPLLWKPERRKLSKREMLTSRIVGGILAFPVIAWLLLIELYYLTGQKGPYLDFAKNLYQAAVLWASGH
jgi:hypothetical protein